MKSLSVLLPLLAATSAIANPLEHNLSPRSAPSKAGYTITFLDDFTGASGSLPSSSNWIIDTGTSYPGGPAKWGNNELETYTRDPKNLRVTSGHTLIIVPLLNKATNTWTSGRIETTRTDFMAAPGKKLLVEARIKLGDAPASQQQGIWPAFWALGQDFRANVNSWPAPSEWDFMENLNGQSTIYSTLHCGTAPGGPCNEFNGLGNGGVAFSRIGWHTYGFVVDRSMVGAGKPGTWKDETLTWLLDGKTVLTVKGAQVNDETAWGKIAHQGHFLLLNVAVGGYWPGYPNAQTASGTSVQMEVDYVGVWNSI